MYTNTNNNYTYNLNVLLADSKNNLIQNQNLLDKVKYEVINMEPNIYNQKPLKWYQKKLKKPESFFLGDLSMNSIHEYNFVYDYTKIILDKIEEKMKRESPLIANWKIIFHVSAL